MDNPAFEDDHHFADKGTFLFGFLAFGEQTNMTQFYCKEPLGSLLCQIH